MPPTPFSLRVPDGGLNIFLGDFKPIYPFDGADPGRKDRLSADATAPVDAEAAKRVLFFDNCFYQDPAGRCEGQTYPSGDIGVSGPRPPVSAAPSAVHSVPSVNSRIMRKTAFQINKASRLLLKQCVQIQGRHLPEHTGIRFILQRRVRTVDDVEPEHVNIAQHGLDRDVVF